MDLIRRFENNDVRIITEENGDMWFVAKDVCDYFGDTDHKRSVSRIDEDEKALVPVVDTLGRRQQATAVNESGLYSLLFGFEPEQSRKDGGAPNAPHITERISKIKAFKKWITSEVIPSIRKTGGYSVNKTPQLLSVEVIKSLLCQYDAEKTRADELQMLNSAIIPAANYTAEVLMSQDLITINIIAAELHISNIALYAFLKEKEIIYKQGGIWHPGSYWRCYELFGYHTHRYFDGKGEPHATEYLKATQRGRKFILALYNNENPEKSAKVIYRETFEPLKLAMGV
jgi:prophage antirepressor-like protein